MKKFFILLFIVAVGGHIVFSGSDEALLPFLFKPFIIPALAAYFAASLQTKNIATRLVLIALFFSWLGDVLLIFEKQQALFFILGLVSFLIAHIFFIICFSSIQSAEGLAYKAVPIAIAVLFYGILISILYSHLGPMKIPVCVYGLVICIMLLFALHLAYIKENSAGKLIAAGAVAFVISDSCLAINKFYQPFAYAGVIIMVTYALAQFLNCEGNDRS